MSGGSREGGSVTLSAHTVLAIPVPPFDEVVRERTAFYDASFVSRDPDFVHAHITVLAPWITNPASRDLAVVAGIAATQDPVEVTLAEVDTFPDGVIYLRPEPDEPFRKLTTALLAEFPDYLPYGGRFPDPVPHLTLDHRAGGVTPDAVRERLIGRLPGAFTMERLDLQWWANNACRLLQSWPLGTCDPPRCS